MTKKNRTYNTKYIKARDTYTVKELAEAMPVHPRTVQAWRKQGLSPVAEDMGYLLFLGLEIIRFLKVKRQKHKHPLTPGEFYCVTCRQPRHGQADSVSIVLTGKPLGKSAKQAFIRGICETCGRPLLLFSSDLKIRKMIDGGLLSKEHQAVLLGADDGSVNTDIRGGQNNETQFKK